MLVLYRLTFISYIISYFILIFLRKIRSLDKVGDNVGDKGI